MKKLFTLGALLFAGTAFAQTENVGIGTAQPDKSAILDLSSSNKGFLLPRMSESQRLNIVKPAQGLQVYQTDGNAGLYVYNGKDWENASKSVAAATDPWLRGGNAISPGEFIGTTNNEPLNIRVFNIKSGLIDPNGGNVLLGYESGLVNLGTFNTALGHQALKGSSHPSSTGNFNTAFGFQALLNNSSGFGNVAIGRNTLSNNTEGFQNLALGAFAMISNQTGSRNMAMGRAALEASVSGSDNVAIGFQAGKSSTGSGNIFVGYEAGSLETGSNKLYISNNSTTTPLIYGDFSAKYVTIGDVTPALRTQGTTSGGYNLLVKGGILTEKVKVALAQAGTDWADYVFEPEYKSKMMTLEEIEKFTLLNKHLPNVPSAKEMVEKGLDVSQTSKMFMEKIEELTLYIIELNKRIKDLESNRK